MIINEAQITYVRKEIAPVQLEGPETCYEYIHEWFYKNASDFTREHCIIVCLNSRNFVIQTKILTVGTDNQTLVKPADVLRHVLISGCNSFILFHNHPSGDPQPSSADQSITRRLKEAAQAVGMNFLDHVVIGEVQNDPLGLGYYSFTQEGIL